MSISLTSTVTQLSTINNYQWKKAFKAFDVVDILFIFKEGIRPYLTDKRVFFFLYWVQQAYLIIAYLFPKQFSIFFFLYLLYCTDSRCINYIYKRGKIIVLASQNAKSACMLASVCCINKLSMSTAMTDYVSLHRFAWLTQVAFGRLTSWSVVRPKEKALWRSSAWRTLRRVTRS